jgi:ABC-2 type transport system ATP-binding protein
MFDRSKLEIEPILSANCRQDGVQPTIQAVNLTKVFNKRVCVDHLNFSVYPGELYALLGDNGAGKTTTINMLTTLLSPTEGKFFISGHDGVKDAESAKKAFGVVSQDVSIYQELTAYENLAFIANLYAMPKQQSELRIRLLLAQNGLADRANDRVGQFSDGMQRKLSIACAMLPQPKVIFMDEPTVGLDPAARHQIWESLRELRAHGVTILLTTHYLEEAQLLADRIGIIRKGKLEVEGTIEELRHKIHGINSITIQLISRFDDDQLKGYMDRLQLRLPTAMEFDSLRNTLSIAQPKGMELSLLLNIILAWLDEEKIAYSKFSTTEPNLEEVFLAVTGRQRE